MTGAVVENEAGRTAPVRTARVREWPAAIVRAARGVLWYLDSVVGGQDYQRYLAHMRRVHPGRPVLSEREYWRERHTDAERNPGARCC